MINKTPGKLSRIAVAPLLFLIACYQRLLSPCLPTFCRFSPTCSVYAAEALRTRGLFVGGWLAFWRLARCNPFSRGGFDAVPSASLDASLDAPLDRSLDVRS